MRPSTSSSDENDKARGSLLTHKKKIEESASAWSEKAKALLAAASGRIAGPTNKRTSSPSLRRMGVAFLRRFSALLRHPLCVPGCPPLPHPNPIAAVPNPGTPSPSSSERAPPAETSGITPSMAPTKPTLAALCGGAHQNTPGLGAAGWKEGYDERDGSLNEVLRRRAAAVSIRSDG